MISSTCTIKRLSLAWAHAVPPLHLHMNAQIFGDIMWEFSQNWHWKGRDVTWEGSAVGFHVQSVHAVGGQITLHVNCLKDEFKSLYIKSPTVWTMHTVTFKDCGLGLQDVGGWYPLKWLTDTKIMALLSKDLHAEFRDIPQLQDGVHVFSCNHQTPCIVRSAKDRNNSSKTTVYKFTSNRSQCKEATPPAFKWIGKLEHIAIPESLVANNFVGLGRGPC